MLLQFPADRMTAHVRRCATVLQNLHGEDANTFFRAEIAALVTGMRSNGQPDEEISRQAAAFVAAVQEELQSLYSAARVEQSA